MINIRHSNIVIRDIKSALYFYCNILELKLIKKERLTGNKWVKMFNLGNYKVDLTYYKLATKERSSLLELYHFNTKDTIFFHSGASFNHIAFTVDSVNRIYDKLVKEGLKVLSKPKVCDKCKVFFCRDYESNLIEIVEEIK